MTAPTLLMCGCVDKHRPGCPLGRAETIAHEAYEHATAQGRHGLVAAFTALAEAGLLLDVTDAAPEDLLEGVLDELYQCGLIAGGAS